MKSKKLTAVYALIMDLPLSLVITAIALKLGNNLNGPMFVRMACIAYLVTFFVNFLPVGKWGVDFAVKHAKPFRGNPLPSPTAALLHLTHPEVCSLEAPSQKVPLRP